MQNADVCKVSLLINANDGGPEYEMKYEPDFDDEDYLEEYIAAYGHLTCPTISK